MTAGRTLDRPIIVRLVISLLLGVTAAGLFFLNRTSLTRPGTHTVPSGEGLTGSRGSGGHPGEPAPTPLPAALGEIDREVDSVLVHLGIESSWTRKREMTLPNAPFPRIERRVLIPKELATVTINAALNEMARRFNGRAVASENLRENQVTIHIEIDGTIVQTIILRPTKNLRPAARTHAERKV
jgi:hypothetical protein